MSQAVLDAGLVKIQMHSGNEVFKLAVRAMEDAALAALKQNGFDVTDVDFIVSHQANMRIISALGQRLGLPDHKVIANLQKVGNTSAASIPLALDGAVRDGRVKPGHLVLLCAFGGSRGRRPSFDGDSSMKRIAFVFPGRIPGDVGMGRDLGKRRSAGTRRARHWGSTSRSSSSRGRRRT
jgi:hypothetical protein